MATAHAMSTEINKPSFAKVAAASPRGVPASQPAGQSTASAPSNRTDAERQDFPAQTPPVGLSSHENTSAPAPANGEKVHAGITTVSGNKLADGLQEMKLDHPRSSLIVNGSGPRVPAKVVRAGSNQASSDEVSQRADSSSELGAKPPSLDGKSITSGTTFNALDEKESLRPDDSASVKAAEDDDSFSIRGSLAATSRLGSEVAPRVHRIQLGDMPLRTVTSHVHPEVLAQGESTPQSVSSEQQAPADSKMGLLGNPATPDGFNGLYRQTPDEKLLEAMQTPKDRLFLLRLEKDVVDFVQDSKEPYMDLPPCNSFCRMLTHKLADYYHMTHSFEAGAVRIFRTPFCRVPPSLASIAPTAAPSSGTPPPALLPRKIMRRGEEGDIAPPSTEPSKPNSETGSDSKDKNAQAYSKMSREEREEAYNKARERIFGRSTSADGSAADNEDNAEGSRASSVSGKDRSHMGKPKRIGKQRRDDSEGFDSRSQYTAYYPHPHQAPWVSPQYVPVGNQFTGQPQQQFAAGAGQPQFAAQNQAYSPMAPNNGYGQAFTNAAPNFPPPQGSPRFQAPAGQAGSSYGPPAVTGSPQQTWQSPLSQAPQQGGRGATAPPGAPYAFGQLPSHMNPHDPKSQHPIPGSYMRNGFNPKTQSFVPGGAVPSTQPGSGGPGPYHGPATPQFSAQGSPQPMGYGPYPQGSIVHQPQFAGSAAGGYGMARQSSSSSYSSLPPYQHNAMQQQQPQQYMQPPGTGPPTVGIAQPHGPPHSMVAGGLPHPQGPFNPSNPAGRPGLNPAGSQPPVAGIPPHAPGHPHQQHPQAYANLPHYGNPATLPQKPTAL